MPLSLGVKLGPYEILGPIGAGGMGEVYRAKDTRLDRTVAIKVLPSQFSADADRRQRFEREARAVSSLNHPHICALYDVGEQDGTVFLVMEHLEGQTLADALVKGPLPTAQVLRCGAEIADALDKAHRQGIVHRDLKPGNVMLTKSGAKLLDFGLAKLTWLEGAPADVSKLATREKPLTGDGTMLGTFQYMAPEQLEGKAADARTDIFALGSVLYEMATGHRAFEAKSQASLIVAILEHEPAPMTTLQPLTPPDLERLVKVCLAKDPDDRLQTAHDVMQALKWVEDAGPSPAPGTVTVPPRQWRQRIPWAVGGVIIGGLIVGLAALASRPGRPIVGQSRVLRLNIAPPEKVSVGAYLAFSPDGRRLAFTGTDAKGTTMVWVRALDAEAPASVAGTEGGSFPFWSPDSRELAFYAGNKLKRVDLAGGSPQTICDSEDGRGGTWNSSGQILFAPGCCNGLFVVPASGGPPEAVTSLDASRSEQSHRWPRFLPDGRHFLYSVQTGASGADAQGIYLGTLDSAERKQLAGVLSPASFEAPDHLFYVKEGRLVTRRLDLGRLELAAEAPVAEHVRVDLDFNGLLSFATAPGGVVAYRGGGQPQMRLTWFDRAGRNLGSLGELATYTGGIALAPDDLQVAASVNYSAWAASLWLLDTVQGHASRFTFEELEGGNPRWSRDGRQILFAGTPKGRLPGIYRKSTTGIGPAELVLQGATTVFVDDWSADGRFVVYEVSDPKTRSDLWVLPLDGDRRPKPFLTTLASEAQARLSPDGKWIAYVSDVLGQAEVFVQPFPSGPGRWQASTAGGNMPLWRRDGKELFYLSADRKLMAVAYRSAGGRFEGSAPQALFSPPFLPVLSAGGGWGYTYDVSADGQRFLVARVVEETPPPITVLLNWAPERAR